jgi:hypothetical protein
MLELNVRQYSQMFEEDFGGKFIKRSEGQPKKSCNEIGEKIERQAMYGKKEVTEVFYKLDLVNKKHLVGIIMRGLGETRRFEEYKNDVKAVEVINAVEKAKVHVYQQPFTTIQTASYGTQRCNSTCTFPSYNEASIDVQKLYNCIVKHKQLTWTDFINNYVTAKTVVLDDDTFNKLPECKMKEFIGKDKVVNISIADIILLIADDIKEFKTQKMLIKSAGDEFINSKTNKIKGASNSRIGTLSRPAYKIHYSFKVYVELSDDDINELDGCIAQCVNDSIVEINERDTVENLFDLNNVNVVVRKGNRVRVEIEGV